jgi:hypothetical protein
VLGSRHIRLVHLQRPFDALYQPKKHSQDQHHDRHPESIPLHAIPPVIPPLRERPRPRLVKDLLQDDEAIAPEVEVLDLAVVGAELALLDDPAVEVERRREALEPSSRVGVGLREEEGEGAEGFVDELFGEEGTGLGRVSTGSGRGGGPLATYLRWFSKKVAW